METMLIGYIVVVNLLGMALMGIDKRRAVRKRQRIPEKTLFLISLIGGSIGTFVGMYLFRHKTRHLRFTIGIPVIMILQLLCVIFLFIHHRERMESPSTAVNNELALIQNLDEDAIQNFISYESLMAGQASSRETGPETVEAIHLFFENFQYHLHSEDIRDDTAVVSAEIINIDTKALATDLCRILTARNLSISPDQQPPKTLNDYYALLKTALESNTYDLVASTAYFHLNREENVWVIQADEILQDELVSGFITWMNDPTLLSPQEVLSIYLDEFTSLSADEWIAYLKVDDIFSTNSPSYASAVDRSYIEKIADYFSYSIGECSINEDTAFVDITLTSVDMPHILSAYKSKLLKYAHTTESITSDNAALSDTAAQYLLETFREDTRPADIPVTVTLHNDGHSWQPEISYELTNAFLGDITEALETFQSS